MNTKISREQSFALAFASAWGRVEKRLDNSLGSIRGISLAEFRLLRALGDAPGAQASRVDLAEVVALTPSGVTRALRPMEKLGIVSTVKSKRDARLAIAALTPAGRELLSDASGVVDDAMQSASRGFDQFNRGVDVRLNRHVEAHALHVLHRAQCFDVDAFPGAGIDKVTLGGQPFSNMVPDPGAGTGYQDGFLRALFTGNCRPGGRGYQ